MSAEINIGSTSCCQSITWEGKVWLIAVLKSNMVQYVLQTQETMQNYKFQGGTVENMMNFELADRAYDANSKTSQHKLLILIFTVL